VKHTLARTLGLASVAALATATVGATSASAHVGHTARVVGHVYEATNASAGNAVQVFDRRADGSLVAAGSVATGGKGAGASLHSQGGLVRAGNVLFVVNAGDNTVSTLAITGHGLVRRSTVASHGQLPVSVTARGGVAYVLNQGNSTISGFVYSSAGWLRALPSSTRALRVDPTAGTADAAEVAFQGNGNHLIVTERATNAIESFPVRFGYAGHATSTASAGATPYGFDFDGRGHALVSEASGSASSYRVGQALAVISAAVSDTQAAPCWLVTTPNGRWAYVINAGSATVSSYAVGSRGALTLINATAASTGTGSGPTDATVSPTGRTLSVRLGSGAVASFVIAANGSLHSTGSALGAVGIGSAGLASN
jgi:6-phosphogluconolactonase